VVPCSSYGPSNFLRRALRLLPDLIRLLWNLAPTHPYAQVRVRAPPPGRHRAGPPLRRLTWQGQTFVLSGGADVTREVRIELTTGSVAVLRETLVLGRTGEPGGRLLQTSRATLDGHPLLAEDLDLAPSQLRPGALGHCRVVDTVSILGRRAPGIPPPAVGSHRLDLDGPGTLVRSLATEAHVGSLAPVWAAMTCDSDRELS